MALGGGGSLRLDGRSVDARNELDYAGGPGGDDPNFTGDADQFLLELGIVLRRVDVYGLPNALRMTIGSAEANRATIDALGEFLRRAT